ncbi:MAG: DUF5344 family protein [Clostridia bacterium]|nr:DUF5344 family protein [Clostridia bacterium]
MAEFKISPGLSGEVTTLKNKGKELATDSVDIDKSDVKTLKTSMEYIQQQKDIRTLLRLYAALVKKDADDMKKMINDVHVMDEKIASGNR